MKKLQNKISSFGQTPQDKLKINKQKNGNANKNNYVLWVMVFFASVIFGLLLGIQNYFLLFILVILIIGPMLIFFPKLGLWTAIVGTLVVAGLIDLYLPSLSALKWGIPVLSVLLAIFTMVNSFFLEKRKEEVIKEKSRVIIWLLLFIIVSIFSSLANWQGISAFAVGLKGYFQVWGLLFVIYYLYDNEKDAGHLISFFLFLALIQWPFVLHQFFVMVPKRTSIQAAEHGIVAVDVVAGTFGASMNGGGRSPSLALLSMISLSLLLARWKVGLINTKKMVILGCIGIFPLFLNEAKVVIVLMPILVFMIFQDQILKSPIKALLGFAVTCSLLFSILASYLILPGSENEKSFDATDFYHESVDYNIGNRGYGNFLLNRTTVYPFWLKEHMRSDKILELLIGHGPGAGNGGSSIIDSTLATKQYLGYGIGLTSMSRMLWEIGLLGTIIGLILLFSIYKLAGKLSRQWENTNQWPLIKTAQISIPLFVVNLFHNDYFVADLSFQMMFVLILGYILVMSKIQRGKKI